MYLSGGPRAKVGAGAGVGALEAAGVEVGMPLPLEEAFLAS